MDEPTLFDDAISMALIFIGALRFASRYQLIAGRNTVERRLPSNRRGPTIRRERRTVSQIMEELGGYTRRYYRMEPSSFWALHELLKEKIDEQAGTPCQRNGRKRRRTAPNGLVSSSLRLSCFLRYAAGGCPLDIALVHHISHSEVFRSVWFVLAAIHATPALDIKFPQNEFEQRRMAKEFEKKSGASFGCCVAAIDGMLLWTAKPSEFECLKAKCGAKKFYCNRKHKFGLNMQGACDARKRFVDVSIEHPGSTSDYLAWITSPLYHKMEEGLLAIGLCLFGDCAYVSTPYMATPFKNVGSGPKDAYNYFHSQLRINIECAFGMLVHRFLILRKAFPVMSLAKTVSFVIGLCKIHNFCIDQHDANIPFPTEQDQNDIELHEGIRVSSSEDNPTVPELLGGGDHQDDHDRNIRRQDQRTAISEAQSTAEELPQQTMLNQVIRLDLRRPTPRDW